MASAETPSPPNEPVPETSDATSSSSSSSTSTPEEPEIDQGKVASAVQFLTAPRLQSRPWDVRVAFLRKKGLTEPELAQAQKRAKAILASTSTSVASTSTSATATPLQPSSQPPPLMPPRPALPPALAYAPPPPPPVNPWSAAFAPAVLTTAFLGGISLLARAVSHLPFFRSAEREAALKQEQQLATFQSSISASIQEMRQSVDGLNQTILSAQQRRADLASSRGPPGTPGATVTAAALAAQLRASSVPSTIPTPALPSLSETPVEDDGAPAGLAAVVASLQKGFMPPEIDTTIDDSPRQAPADVAAAAAASADPNSPQRPPEPKPWEARRAQRRQQLALKPVEVPEASPESTLAPDSQ